MENRNEFSNRINGNVGPRDGFRICLQTANTQLDSLLVQSFYGLFDDLRNAFIDLGIRKGIKDKKRPNVKLLRTNV